MPVFEDEFGIEYYDDFDYGRDSNHQIEDEPWYPDYIIKRKQQGDLYLKKTVLLPY